MSQFTSANAREFAAKALIARRANRERRQNLEETLAALTAKVSALAPLPAEELSGYAQNRLARVRKQLDRIDALMLTETDPGKLDRLASAQNRLSEQERILAGRPLPGSIRRPVEKSRRRAPEYHAGPMFCVPEPIVAPQPLEIAAVQTSVSAASQSAEMPPEANQGQPVGAEVRKVVWTYGERMPAKRP